MRFDILSPEFLENPYGIFSDLRAHAPVTLVAPMGYWAISRYDDVIGAARNTRVFSSRRPQTELTEIGGGRFFGGRSLIASDPPEHTRFRQLIAKSFTPGSIATLESRIIEITDALVDSLVEKGEFDLIADFATPLPVTVISELLGVSADHRKDFKRWSDDIVSVRTVYHRLKGESRRVAVERILTSCEEFCGYFGSVIEYRRRNPGNDLVSLLVAASADGAVLTPEEVLNFVRLLLIAGNETTTNLIGNAMLALLAFPEQMAVLENDPGLIPALVEETLRYDGPVLGLTREVTEDTRVRDVTLPRGSTALLLFASANHDERRFPRPEVFDLKRNTQGHVAFGYGIHLCIGAPLARLEARIAFSRLFSSLTGFEFAGDFQRIDSFTLRGVRNLPLRAKVRPEFAARSRGDQRVGADARQFGE